MRWILFAIVTYILIVVQTTVGRILTLEMRAIGTIVPDLIASLAVFIALYAREATDAMIAGVVLGFALDLTTAGGSGSTAVVGPMAIIYAFAARGLFTVREAFFRERIFTRMLMTLLFCLLTHGLWVTAQSLLGGGSTTWSEYRGMLLQAVMVSVYSALLGPVLIWFFAKKQRWMIRPSPGLWRRTRR